MLDQQIYKFFRKILKIETIYCLRTLEKKINHFIEKNKLQNRTKDIFDLLTLIYRIIF